MPKEIILDVTTGIVVLGSVFGFTHLMKIKKKITQVLLHHKLIQENAHRPVQSDSGAPSPSQRDTRSA